MSFTELLKNAKKVNTNVERVVESSDEELYEAAKKPEEVLRGTGFKIKLVTPTSFGTQISFAKKYSKEEIDTLLKDFKIKYKNNDKFISEIFII